MYLYIHIYNSVSERKKLVTGLTYSVQLSKLYRPHTSELKSESKYQLLFYWKNFNRL